MKGILFFYLIISLFINKYSIAQPGTLTQTVKGVVIDADSKRSLSGMVVALIGSSSKVVTDSAGNFKMAGVPVGLQSFSFSGINYETSTYPGIVVNSGKEVFLEVSLSEKITQLEEVFIRSNKKNNSPTNEFASASARSFSMEEAKKYPITGFDPGRIVQNFAGVMMTEDDNNAIIVRGNSPKGILWKLEGIEIPNPNHFGSTGAGGGNISMLSSSTLDKSDFYTGAFPAEFGNALSGVFDLKLRKGNNDKNEHSIMLGMLGIEAATEGPFKKHSSSSYLVNFRYSTFALIKGFAEIDGVTPDYQDLSFKISLPTKKAGNFSVFGLGGINKSIREPRRISFDFGGLGPLPLFSVHEKGSVGVIGLSHQFFLTKRSYLQTILAATSDNYQNNTDSLDAHNNYARGAVERTKFFNTSYKLSSTYNNKINSRNTMQAGIGLSKLSYRFIDQQFNPGTQNYDTAFNSQGNSMLYEGYIQWKWKPNDHFEIVPGLHYTLLALNKSHSIEPRLSVSYNFSGNQKFIVAAGLHSKPEHLSTYFFHKNNYQDNQDIGLPKAAHLVVGYHKKFKDFLLKIETYYQYLFNIAVEKNNSGFFSMINAWSVYDLYDLDSSLISSGTGKNYGLDLTIEKPLTKNWHFLLTASLLKSSYTTYDGKSFPTRLDRGYQFTAITGKDWSLHKNERKRIGINGKLVTAGGLRESPVDEARSNLQNGVVYVKDQYYSKRTSPYFRMDAGISYKINRKKSTHTFVLDIQNVINYQNVESTSYNLQSRETTKEYGLGLFPLFNYRIEF